MVHNRGPDVARARRRFGISLRAWLIGVGLVGAGIGLFYRRTPITPKTAASLAVVASLDKPNLWRVAWSPDRRRLAVLGWEGAVEVRDPISLKLLETIGAGRKIIQFAFSPDERVVAYSGNTNVVMLLDREARKEIALDVGAPQADLAFSPDGNLLATAVYGIGLILWRTDGAQVRTIDPGPVEGGLTVAFSTDGRTLALGNRNGPTRLHDVATGALRITLPRSSSHELQFDPSGTRLAVVYADGAVALWRVADGTLLAERATPAPELYSVDWSPDGSMLATSGRDAPITLWDARDLSIVREIAAPSWVIRVKFSPDGLNLIQAVGGLSPNGARRLEVLGIEGALFTLLNRPRR